MHEYHIVESIVKQILEKAKSSNAARVIRVTLVMGELSGLKDGSVRSYFENLSRGTLLEGAELIIKPVRSKLKCKDCGEIFECKKADFNCPKCSGLGVLTDSGKEFYIDNIEIDSDA